MIWKFHFSRHTMAWILTVSLMAGLGMRGLKLFQGESFTNPGRVTSSPKALHVKRLADSIMVARAERVSGPININTATAVELDRLDGIGYVLSNRIVEYRETNGPFQSIDDLEKVSGIGPKKIAAIRDRCVIGQTDSIEVAITK